MQSFGRKCSEAKAQCSWWQISAMATRRHPSSSVLCRLVDSEASAENLLGCNAVHNKESFRRRESYIPWFRLYSIEKCQVTDSAAFWQSATDDYCKYWNEGSSDKIVRDSKFKGRQNGNVGSANSSNHRQLLVFKFYRQPRQISPRYCFTGTNTTLPAISTLGLVRSLSWTPDVKWPTA